MRAATDTTAPAAPYDAATLVDLESVFGRTRLMALLDGLAREIDGRLSVAATEPGHLADDAHVLTSVSGTLGFAPLSRACAALERACLRGEDPSGPLSVARGEAERASAALAALRQAD